MLTQQRETIVNENTKTKVVLADGQVVSFPSSEKEFRLNGKLVTVEVWGLKEFVAITSGNLEKSKDKVKLREPAIFLGKTNTLDGLLYLLKTDLAKDTISTVLSVEDEWFDLWDWETGEICRGFWEKVNVVSVGFYPKIEKTSY